MMCLVPYLTDQTMSALQEASSVASNCLTLFLQD